MAKALRGKSWNKSFVLHNGSDPRGKPVRWERQNGSCLTTKGRPSIDQCSCAVWSWSNYSNMHAKPAWLQIDCVSKKLFNFTRQGDKDLVAKSVCVSLSLCQIPHPPFPATCLSFLSLAMSQPLSTHCFQAHKNALHWIGGKGGGIQGHKQKQHHKTVLPSCVTINFQHQTASHPFTVNNNLQTTIFSELLPTRKCCSGHGSSIQADTNRTLFPDYQCKSISALSLVMSFTIHINLCIN